MVSMNRENRRLVAVEAVELKKLPVAVQYFSVTTDQSFLSKIWNVCQVNAEQSTDVNMQPGWTLETLGS